MEQRIKTRRVVKDIKTLNRTETLANHLKDTTIRTKERAEDSVQPRNESASGYAQDQIVDKAQALGDKSIAEIQGNTRRLKESVKTRHQAAKIQGEVTLGEGKTIRQSPYSAAKSRRALTASKTGKHSREIKTAEMTGTKGIKTSRKAKHLTKQTASQSSVKAAHHTAQTAVRAQRASAKAAAKASQAAAKTAVQGAKALAKAVITGVKATIAAGKALMAAIASGGSVAVIIILLIVLFGGALCTVGSSNASAVQPVSAEVEAYSALIQHYATQHGIPEYTTLIKAVMMQESGGNGGDPMQCSACGYNTEYPGGITNPEYSIDVGIHYLADCLNAAGVQNPMDLDHIKLALQGYNFGAGYIPWALENDGGYFLASAQAFAAAQDGSYTPAPGDIIFFTWSGGGPEHVGVVESVSDGMVNTIEGNTSDSCARRSYALGSGVIYGYGVPND